MICSTTAVRYCVCVLCVVTVFFFTSCGFVSILMCVHMGMCSRVLVEGGTTVARVCSVLMTQIVSPRTPCRPGLSFSRVSPPSVLVPWRGESTVSCYCTYYHTLE